MLNCFISSFQMLHLYLVLLLSIWIWSLHKVTGREYELHWRANCSQRGSRKLDWKFTSCSPSLSGLSVRSWYRIYLNCRNLFLKHNGCQMWDRTCFPFPSDKLRSSMYLMGSLLLLFIFGWVFFTLIIDCLFLTGGGVRSLILIYDFLTSSVFLHTEQCCSEAWNWSGSWNMLNLHNF